MMKPFGVCLSPMQQMVTLGRGRFAPSRQAESPQKCLDEKKSVALIQSRTPQQAAIMFQRQYCGIAPLSRLLNDFTSDTTAK
jgi:hypothetical protein